MVVEFSLTSNAIQTILSIVDLWNEDKNKWGKHKNIQICFRQSPDNNNCP